MKLTNSEADIFVPDGIEIAEALERTTHLAIVAHQDDLEILAFHGIKECYKSKTNWFTGVVCGDGAGSPRAGKYANYSDAEMRKVRREEQRAAAKLGEYSAVIQLDYSSARIKDQKEKNAIESDLIKTLENTLADTVYLHNPCDSHDSHVAVFARSLAALRKLNKNARPKQVWGCEVWRDLDWLTGTDKKALAVSGQDDLARELCAIFDSQVSGGKRYDLATLARRQAHATFSASHAADTETALTLATDLMPLLNDPALSSAEFASRLIARFSQDVLARLGKY
ncbi:MAG: PIG-L family deacetylase [Bdellovibrionia bacterium]